MAKLNLPKIEQLDRIPELPEKEQREVVSDIPKYQQKLIQKMESILSDKFDKQIQVSAPPACFSQANLKKWKKFNLFPVYLPDKNITQDRELKDWIKLENWFYKKVKSGDIKGKNPTKLISGWYLIDITQSVDYTDGSQVYPNDPLSDIIANLRNQNKIGKHDITPLGSRFSFKPESEWSLIFQALLKELGLTQDQAEIRLERAIEFNAIGNLYDPNRGKFDSWEWFNDLFLDVHRLIGGPRGNGGLASVDRYWRDNRSDGVAGRPLTRFRSDT